MSIRTIDYFSTYFSCCYERHVLHPQWQQSLETMERIRTLLGKCTTALDTLESEAKEIAEKEYKTTLG